MLGKINFVLVALVALTSCQSEFATETSCPEQIQVPVQDVKLTSSQFTLNWPEGRHLAQGTIKNEGELAEAILEKGLVDKEMVNSLTQKYQNSLIVKHYLGEFIKKNVTADSIEEYFENNKSKYMRRQYAADIIFLRLKLSDDEYSQEQKRQLLQGVVNSIVTGATIDDIKDKYAATEIEFTTGKFNEKNLLPELVENIKRMSETETVGPIETNDGFYVLHLNDVIDEMSPFETVMKDIWYEKVTELRKDEVRRLLRKKGSDLN